MTTFRRQSKYRFVVFKPINAIKPYFVKTKTLVPYYIEVLNSFVNICYKTNFRKKKN